MEVVREVSVVTAEDWAHLDRLATAAGDAAGIAERVSRAPTSHR